MAVRTRDVFVALFYDLMRDHLPTGTVEALVVEQEQYAHMEFLLQGPMALYAVELVDRLRACQAPEEAPPDKPEGVA